MNSITTDAAEDILYGDIVARQVVSEHRWYTKELIVFDSCDVLMGFHYFKPASELQEDQERFEADPVPVFPVVGREITTTVYEKAE